MLQMAYRERDRGSGPVVAERVLEVEFPCF